MLRLKYTAIKAGFDFSQPRDEYGRWSGASGSESRNDTAPNNDPVSLLQNIAYQGEFHDVLRDHMVKVLREAGHTVITEVSLTLPGSTPVTARLDIMTRSKVGELFGFEIKTGENPTFTVSQSIVYPHTVGGAGVISWDPKIATLALTPGAPLPKFDITTVYARRPSDQLRFDPIPSELKYYWG